MSDLPLFRAKIPSVCEVDKPWAVRLLGIAAFTSFTVEFFGNAGGISRYFPRGRDQMSIGFLHKQAGEAQIVITVRDEACLGVQSRIGQFQISPASAYSSASFDNALGDDDEVDDWEQKMIEIDLRFQARDVHAGHGGAPGRQELTHSTILPATGKPPMSVPWHPDTVQQPAALTFAQEPQGTSFFASTSRYSARQF